MGANKGKLKKQKQAKNKTNENKRGQLRITEETRQQWDRTYKEGR